MITFAAEMKRQGKRIASAWLLLSVFVSMILLSGLHRHETIANVAADCVECAHHMHHSGHFTVATDHMDDCVLCQFLTLVYTAASATLLMLFIKFIQKERFILCHALVLREPSLLCTRGPPIML
jgi:hypothetical protein